RAAVERIGHREHAQQAAQRLARVAATRAHARAACAPLSRWAYLAARATVERVAVNVGAQAAAQGLARGTHRRAGRAEADLAGRAGHAARAAIQRILLDVHALVHARHRGAAAAARAADAGRAARA